MFIAYALGDPSVTIEEVTPLVIPYGPLLPSEVGFHDKVATLCVV